MKNRFRKIFLLCILILSFSFSDAFSQHSDYEVDLQEKLMKSSGNEKIDLLNRLGFFYVLQNRVDSLKIISERLEKNALSVGSKSGEADAQLFSLCYRFEKLNEHDAQKKILDQNYESIIKMYEQSKDKQGLIDSYLYIGNMYLDINELDIAFQLFEESLKLIKVNDVNKNNASILISLGFYYLAKGNIAEGLAYHLQADSVLIKHEDPHVSYLIYRGLGWRYANYGVYNTGLKFMFKALQIAEKLNNVVWTADMFNSIGILYDMSEDIADSYKYYKKHLELITQTDERVTIGLAYNNLAIILGKKHEFDEAVQMMSKAIEIMKAEEEFRHYYNCYNSLGMIYEQKGDYPKAKENYFKALEGEEYLKNDNRLYAVICLDAGNILRKTGKAEESLKLLHKSAEIAQTSGLIAVTAASFKGLVESYAAIGQHKTAYEYYKRYLDLKDSLEERAMKTRLGEIEADYVIEEKENELNLLKKEHEIDRFFKHVWLGSFVGVFFISIFIFNRYSEKKKANRNLEEVKKLIEEKNKKMITDLDLAKSIQYSLLPEVFPSDNYCEFFDKFIPSERLSGDFYEIFRLDKDRIGMYIVDVCGHGVSSAMITSFVKGAVVKKEVLNDGSLFITEPKDAVSGINKKMIEADFCRNGFRWYLTMFYGIYNLKTGDFTYSCAGHQHVYHIKQERYISTKQLGESSFPVGWLEEAEFEQKTIALEKSDLLLFLTDGVIEAKSEDNEDEFGSDTLKKTIERVLPEIEKKNSDYDVLLDELHHAVTEFSGKEQQDDDITMFVMHVKEKSEKKAAEPTLHKERIFNK